MYDIAIIGGGINGCGIARDAAGRGYSAYLAEKGDLAGGTSSNSSKLIHGGLRYLEFYEFRLVREALIEREVLWSSAPHIIQPLRFVLPIHSEMRSPWLLRAGLFIYDHLGGRERLPPTRTLDLRSDVIGKPLKKSIKKALEYSDCWVDDARLVVLNAMDARKHGAHIQTRTEVTNAKRDQDHWTITTRNLLTDDTSEIEARILINAAGPWVDTVNQSVIPADIPKSTRLVKGSHIVVPKLYDHDRAYIFQNRDDRILFALPFADEFTLLGTTDEDYEVDPEDAEISEDEIHYLCGAASEYFKTPVTPEHIRWSFSGVRSLFDDGASKAQEATRDYVLQAEGKNDEPRLLNIYGGKITTFRKLAEAVLEEVENALGSRGPAWTETAHLPGGNFELNNIDNMNADLKRAYPFLDEKTVLRLIRAYGTIAHEILKGANSHEDLGQDFGAGLREREVRYLREKEWAMTTDDILWRRTKLGLKVSESDRQRLEDWLEDQTEEVRVK